ncbi:site-specific DNA-methyltransferase [Macrococcoides canis]|uniref:site-specific DNA-methyltransferase n=1 Tax=Macrococcoides canis TaxID=1855823 RepID=UPI0010612234|nr:site-specific DNA-methyltransferase [Macrococcus canis]TDM33012.1 site-specific DNA-methyltransferase [Macrococcus canis]
MKKVPSSSSDLTNENIKKLKELFPEILTDGEQIDFDKLKTILGQEVNGEKERYSFNWYGKKDAILGAQKPSKGTLRPDKEKSKNFDTTENLYIEGDNLEVLKLLQKSYSNKIKMIYIDPPYNTGKDFVYKDNFRDGIENYLEQTGQTDDEGNILSTNSEVNGRYHTNWLNMMYPRLKLARNLLKDDGVIFLSINEIELSNLLKILNEIFGEKNFIGIMSVENNPKGRKNSKFISVSSEFIVVYAKSINNTYFIENIPKKSSDMSLDENGKYVHNSGKRVVVGENNFNKKVSNIDSSKNYSVYYNKGQNEVVIRKETSIYDKDERLIRRGYKRFISHFNNELIENTYSPKKFIELFESKSLNFTENKIFEKNFNDTIRIKSQLVNRKYEAIVNGEKKFFNFDLTTTGANIYIKKLFNKDIEVFEASKNIGLLKVLITLLDDKEFIALDFFSGSGTLGDAIIRENSIDNGSRKFIMVQLPEKLEEKSEAYKDGYRTICDIGEERIRRAGELVKQELIEKNNKAGMLADDCVDPEKLDVGFKVMKLDKSNIREWNSDFEDLEDSLFAYEDVFVEGRSEIDVVYEIMLKNGLDLTYKVNQFEHDGRNIYDVAYGNLFVCLADDIDVSVAQGIIDKRNEYGTDTSSAVFKDAGFKSDADKLNVIELLKDSGYPEENILSI